MSGETRSNTDPSELWQQWYDTATSAWAKALRGDAESYRDPFALYGQWLSGLSSGKDRGPAPASGEQQPSATDFWKEWLEASAKVWEAASGTGANPLGMMTQWTEMIEEARAKLLAGEGVPQDPLTFLIRWYNATSEIWSTLVGDVIGTEEFVAAGSRFIESYTSYAKTFRQLSQEYFSNLQLATRPDIARVASLVVALEDKVDLLEDQFEEYNSGSAKLVVRALAAREPLENLERGLAEVRGALGDPGAAGRRLDGVERKLEQLEGAVRQIQSTLSQLLVAVEKANAAPARVEDAAPEERKAPARRPASGVKTADPG